MRGPKSLLREQLTGQTTGSRTVVEFVDNLKAKLMYSAWEQAAQNDGEAKARSKKYFDRTGTFKPETKFWSCPLLSQRNLRLNGQDHTQSRRRSLMLPIGFLLQTGGS